MLYPSDNNPKEVVVHFRSKGTPMKRYKNIIRFNPPTKSERFYHMISGYGEVIYLSPRDVSRILIHDDPDES